MFSMFIFESEFCSDGLDRYHHGIRTGEQVFLLLQGLSQKHYTYLYMITLQQL